MTIGHYFEALDKMSGTELTHQAFPQQAQRHHFGAPDEIVAFRALSKGPNDHQVAEVALACLRIDLKWIVSQICAPPFARWLEQTSMKPVVCGSSLLRGIGF